MKKQNIVAVAIVVLVAGFGYVGFGQQEKFVDEEIQRWKVSSRITTLSQSEQGNYWARVYARANPDIAYCAEETFDGGFIVSGEEKSLKMSLWPKPIVLKLDSVGGLEWDYLYPDSKLTEFDWLRSYCIIESSDGGFIFVGRSRGTGSPNMGLVAKLFPDGSIEWCINYTKGLATRLDFIAHTADQGYIITGVQGAGQFKDLWVIKLSAEGELEWDKAYGGDGYEAHWPYDRRSSIIQTIDGGYLAVADCDSFTDSEWPDILLLKLSGDGDIEWQKTFGGDEGEFIVSGGPQVQETPSGEIYVTCGSYSFPGTDSDVWVLKLFPTGDIKWQQKYGVEQHYDHPNSIQATDDGGCIIAGETSSPIPGRDTGSYGFLLKLFANGEIDWQQSYMGADEANSAKSIRKLREGGYVVAGTSGLVPNVFVFKVDEKGKINVSDCGVVGPLNFTSSNTNGAVKDVNIVPREVGGVKLQRYLVPMQANFVPDILCWSLHKPPANVNLEQEVNRGLFGGEALNLVSWNPNPENSQFTISEYRVYRKKSPYKMGSYELIGAVAANVLQFTDDNVLQNENYDYVVTSVDAQGRMSGLSEPISTK